MASCTGRLFTSTPIASSCHPSPRNRSLPTVCFPSPSCCSISSDHAAFVIPLRCLSFASPAPFSSLNSSPAFMSARSSSSAIGSLTFATQSPSTAQKSAEADVMGLLLRERIVFLGYNMDEYVADAIISQLLLLDAQDPKKDIRLFINSPGGSTSAAMGIYDAIQLCRADVSTVAFGLAASTAAIVLAGGSRGKRFAMPNARIMMHQPLGGASGQAIDVEIQAKEIMYHRKNVTRIFSQITGRPFEQVEKDIDRDRYMSPMEAVEYGILDGVIDKDTIIPLGPLAEKALRRSVYKDAEKEPRKFLTPVVPDTEVY